MSTERLMLSSEECAITGNASCFANLLIAKNRRLYHRTPQVSHDLMAYFPVYPGSCGCTLISFQQSALIANASALFSLFIMCFTVCYSRILAQTSRVVVFTDDKHVEASLSRLVLLVRQLRYACTLIITWGTLSYFHVNSENWPRVYPQWLNGAIRRITLVYTILIDWLSLLNRSCGLLWSRLIRTSDKHVVIFISEWRRGP